MQLTYVVDSEVLLKAKIHTQITFDYDPLVDDLNACIVDAISKQSWTDVDDYDIEKIEDVLEIIDKDELED
jgi:hypothetical protein